MPSISSCEAMSQGQDGSVSGMDDLESLVSVCSLENLHMLNRTKLNERMKTMIYDRYSFNRDHCSTNMPIHKCRQEIMDAIRENPVVVLQGNTGCGKTTQVRSRDHINVNLTVGLYSRSHKPSRQAGGFIFVEKSDRNL